MKHVFPQNSQAFGVVLIGQQERPGTYSLDTYMDFTTGQTLTRMPLESLEQAMERIRKPFREANFE